jgi:hypothetical protein
MVASPALGGLPWQRFEVTREFLRSQIRKCLTRELRPLFSQGPTQFRPRRLATGAPVPSVRQSDVMEELGQWPTRTNTGHKLGAHLAALPAELGDETLQWPALAPEVSLKRLDTDHLDLYLLHWPNGVTNLSSVVTAFENLRSAGKIRAWAVCGVRHEPSRVRHLPVT